MVSKVSQRPSLRKTATNGDSSLGLDIEPRIGTGCGPLKMLGKARNRLGSHTRKRSNQKSDYRTRPKPQVALHSFRVSVHTVPSVNFRIYQRPHEMG